MPMHMTCRVVMNEDGRRTNSCRSACCLVETLHRLLNLLLVGQQRFPSPNRVLQQVWASQHELERILHPHLHWSPLPAGTEAPSGQCASPACSARSG